MTSTSRDTFVIYHSAEDGCWVAHSLETDQIGDGASVMEALESVMRHVQFLFDEAAKDESIAIWRKAPPEVFAMAKDAKPLPAEIMEIACLHVHGRWPDYVLLPDVRAPGPFAIEQGAEAVA